MLEELFVRCKIKPKTGDRLGMIRFGSRVDLFLTTRPLVKLGQNVLAGESLIAKE